MKTFYVLLGAVGAFVLLGAAGESDVFGLPLEEILFRMLAGSAMILAARAGFVQQQRIRRREHSRRLSKKTAGRQECVSSKAA